MKRTKTSRLSLQSTLNRVTEERDAFAQALEDILDILEDVGMLEPQEPENVGEEDLEPLPETIIPGTAEKVE